MAATIHNALQVPETRWVTLADHRTEVRQLKRVARQLLAKAIEASAGTQLVFTDEEIIALTTDTTTTEGE